MRKVLPAVLFILPVLMLLPHLAQFPFLPGSPFSDILISHYPNGLFLQRTLQEWKTIPLWSPLILSGYPFAADPLSGLYYLPGWLALAFPLPLGFNLLVVLHLAWGGVGMYSLLRAEGLFEPAALLGALTFEALPKLYSHLGAGHLTLIYAVAWTPWLLYVERRMAGRHTRLPVAGIILGTIAVADVRWAAYAGLLWLAYSLFCYSAEKRAASDFQNPEQTGQWVKEFGAWAAGCLLNILVAGLVAAPLLLPLGQYTRLATRSQLTPVESFTLSLPPGNLLGLAYPVIGGTAEWVLYPGAISLLLALYVLSSPPARRRCGFWLVGIGLTLIFALGSYIPPLEWIARLPGMNLLRVPPRALFLTGLCFCVTAGFGLDSLLKVKKEEDLTPRDLSGLIVFSVSTFFILFGLAGWAVVDSALARIQFAWGGIFLLISAAVILMARARRLSPGLLTVIVLSTALVDLSGVNGLALNFRPASVVLSEQSEAAVYLKERENGTLYRVYSPSYSLPQQTAAWYGIPLADGVDPLQLNAYVHYMEAATGVPADGYSVTLPAFAGGDPAADNSEYAPDAEKLGLLNVKYLISAFPLPENGLKLLVRFGNTHIYENRLALPRAWVQPPGAPPGKEIQSEPEVKQHPDRVKVKAQGPGLLVLSEIAYPGWQVTVDGRPAQIETVAGVLRGVRLGAGKHSVDFVFRPLMVYTGVALALLVWTALGVVVLRRRVLSGADRVDRLYG